MTRLAPQAAVAPGHWAELQGMCAKMLGARRGQNPYPRKSAERVRWSAGHKAFAVSSLHVKPPSVGRGRSKLGQRKEWTAADICALLAFYGSEPVEATGARIGKTGQACKNKIHRIRKEQGHG